MPDDILVFGRTPKEHDNHLTAVLSRIHESYLLDGLTGQVRQNRQHIMIVPTTHSHHRTETNGAWEYNSLPSTLISQHQKQELVHILLTVSASRKEKM